MGRFEEGRAVRKAVMGSEYVERSFREADEFTRAFQELVTEYAWGAVWSRPGLSRKVRSLLTVAVTAAANRPHELRLHLRGALRGVAPPRRSARPYSRWRCTRACPRPWTPSARRARCLRNSGGKPLPSTPREPEEPPP